MALEMCNGIFSYKNMARVANSVLIDDMASKKWSTQRVQDGLERLRLTYEPSYVFKGSIKLEAGKPGKPPRLLVADGDEGQIMAWMVAHIFESLLFTNFKHKSIKGDSKAVAMSRIMRDLRHPVPCSVIENDGTAFDLCCSQKLRDCTENVVLHHVTEFVTEYFLEESHWAKQHLKACTKASFTLYVRGEKGEFLRPDDLLKKVKPCFDKIKVAATRRSGHRLTSGFNWLLNYICSMWVIYGPNAIVFANPTALSAVDIFSRKRWCRMGLEGDDNVTSLSPKVGAKELEVYTERWKTLGHLPKMYIREPGEKGEFTGWNFLTDSLGPIVGSEVPDVPRQLANVAVSCSSALREAYDDKDAKVVGGIAFSGLFACANSMAEKVPTVALALRRWSDEWLEFAGGEPSFTREDQIKINGGTLHGIEAPAWATGSYAVGRLVSKTAEHCDFRSDFESRLTKASTDMEKEIETVVAMGWATEDEWRHFAANLPSISVHSDNGALRAIAPPCFL